MKSEMRLKISSENRFCESFKKPLLSIVTAATMTILMILSLCVSLSGCTFDPSAFGKGSKSNSDEEYEGSAQRTIYAMDTVMSLTVYHDDEEKAEAALDDAQAEIMRLDALFERIPTDLSENDGSSDGASNDGDSSDGASSNDGSSDGDSKSSDSSNGASSNDGSSDGASSNDGSSNGDSKSSDSSNGASKSSDSSNGASKSSDSSDGGSKSSDSSNGAAGNNGSSDGGSKSSDSSNGASNDGALDNSDSAGENSNNENASSDDIQNAASDVYRLNKTRQTEVSADTAAVLRTALEVAADTDGAFDITIAPIMDLWGFYGQNYRVPESAEIQKTLQQVNWENVKVEITDENTDKKTARVTLGGDSQIDLGGIAKGYLSDRIADIFRDDDISSAIISLGGNVYAIGSKTDGSDWSVAVQNPEDDSDYIATVKISDKAAITSGSYQRYFEEGGKIYHHIIDPHTGRPTENELTSVTIISDSGVRADALSTAMFVKGLDGASEYWRDHKDEFDAIFVTTDGKVYVTKGIEKSVETDDKCSVIE